MSIDFSKAAAIHRLYGHTLYLGEVLNAGKSKSFITAVCESVKCKEHKNG